MMRTIGAVIALLFGDTFAQLDYSATSQPGRITFYDQTPVCACDIPQSEWPTYTAALDETHFQGGTACGATARLRNGTKVITVTIVDLCPKAGNEQWCSGDKPHFDLGGASTFGLLEPTSTGVRDIFFEWVPTPVGANPVKLRFKDGINRWWVALQVLNHRYPIAKLEILDPQTGTWIVGNRTLAGMWNYFQFSFSGAGLQTPFQIRITDQYGQVIAETASVLQEKYQWTGRNQFPILPEHSAIINRPNRGLPRLPIHGNKESGPYDLRGRRLCDPDRPGILVYAGAGQRGFRTIVELKRPDRECRMSGDSP